jgi:glycosyltransferase involved in cell wall biosynthesis
VCGDAALYADQTRIEPWIEAIVRLGQDHGLRRRLIAAGQARAARFTWRQAAEQVIGELLMI